MQDSDPFLLVVGWHSLLQKRVFDGKQSPHVSSQYFDDALRLCEGCCKKDPGVPPTVPSVSAAMQSSDMGSLLSPNSVRACFMIGLACTSYAINILFNQIFKTFSFGVGAQQVCILAMMAFSAFSKDARLATEPVWSICTVPLAFGTCALLRGTDGSPVSDNVWSEPAFSFKGLRPRVLCSH